MNMVSADLEKSTNTIHSRSFLPLTSRLLTTVLLIVAGLGAGLFFVRIPQFIPVTGENVYPESAVVVAAHRLINGLPLYEDYRQSPYLMTAFPPLGYWILGVAAKFGLTSLDSLTIVGRALSVLSLMGATLLGFLWNRRLGYSTRVSLLTPAFYLSFPALIPWAITARPDFSALFLSLAAIFCVFVRPSTAMVAGSGVLAAVAFLIRHNSVAAPLTVVLWLLWIRKWKMAAVFCAAWAIVVGAVLVPVQMSTGGLLTLNLSGAKFGHFAFTYFRDVLLQLLTTPGNGFCILLFALGIFAAIQSFRTPDSRIHLATIYLMVSLGLAVIGSAAAGGGPNHYLEPALAIAILIPFGVARIEESSKGDPASALCLASLVLVLLLPSLDVQRWKWMHERPENLTSLIPLLSDKKVFTDVPFLASRSQQPELVDLSSLINTERVGGWAGWSSAALVKDLQEKKYNLVILSQPVEKAYVPEGRYPRAPRLNVAIRQAISENYRLCSEVTENYIYYPMSTASLAEDGNCSLSSKAQSPTTARPLSLSAKF